MAIAHSLCFAQAKGGVGKTSIATNVAGLSAAADLRVLLVDLDPQGDCARDLGYPRDDGAETSAALLAGTEPAVLRNVRSNLDVIPGGALLGDPFLDALLDNRALADALPTRLEAMIRSAGDYDLVVIDTPPGHTSLNRAVLAVVTTVLAPVRLDASSIEATNDLGERFAKARALNPYLTLAGAVLFAVPVTAHRLEADARRQLLELLGSDALVFRSVVRYGVAASKEARDLGKLAFEVDEISEGARVARFAALRANRDGSQIVETTRFISNAGALADDYHNLTAEVLGFMREQHAEFERASA
ncbi:ParA family protein [Demequina lutea]|uniref:Cellulose biosynthesis protein BcsQ n=1 Tax=Demequina lutea TaxID=431489 RepID=A0A7Y9ZCM3_9MICO|nr:ParA family protein [Demequina lutea]NYI42897.1 cellulose biosynthesis protein BcsQ [Demequina lutea]